METRTIKQWGYIWFGLMMFFLVIILFFGLLSTKSDDLSNIVIAIGTAVAAFGTIGTFIFSIHVNSELVKSQESLRKEAIEHEKEQRKLWDKQHEMLVFQMYESHKTQFFNRMKQLEKV